MSTLLRIECPLWSGLGVHFAPEYAGTISSSSFVEMNGEKYSLSLWRKTNQVIVDELSVFSAKEGHARITENNKAINVIALSKDIVFMCLT